VEAIFVIAALPKCEIRPEPSGADSDARILGGRLAANSRIGDGVAYGVAAIGRRESEPGSRTLLIQDRNRIAGHGRHESRSLLDVA
jgi:hypothetical protein